jgi:hypothetical protein
MSAPLPLANRNAEIIRLWHASLPASAIAAQLEGVTAASCSAW